MIKIKAYYIKETDKPNIIKQILNVVEVENNEIVIQPIKEKYTQKHITKLVKKINKICLKKNVQNVVLSKNLKQNKELKNIIYRNNIRIFNGRWLFSYMTYEAIEYILQQIGKKKETIEVSILTISITNHAIETIKMLVKEFKRVNIVTNDINKFKYLENKIYDNYGIMITVTNNKKKSLAKSDIVLNFDFDNDLLNQYNIYEEAIIINILGNMRINKKSFNGLLVNNYEIYSMKVYDFFDLDKLNHFYLKDLVEAKLFRNDKFSNIRSNITSDHYKIKELYGNNGKLF